MDRKTTNVWSDWIEEEFEPDVYAVATLKTACGTLGAGYKTFVAGNDIQYSAVFSQFIRRLSKRVYGRNHFKKYKKLVRSVATLEGDNIHRRCHLNIYLRRPDFMSFDQFKECIITEWRSLDWAMHDIYVEKRTGNCVAYGLKEGCERVLFN